MKLEARTVDGVTIETSSGNVFADLGVPHPQEHLVKVELVSKIDQLLKERRLTQLQAAKLLGVKQPDLSNLLRGRVRGYSVDRLLRFLTALNQNVRITITPVECREDEETRGNIQVDAG